VGFGQGVAGREARRQAERTERDLCRLREGGVLMKQQDRSLLWTLLADGHEHASALRREIIDHQDTNALYIWRVQAATLIEEITDALEERSGDEHYPHGGMEDG
jgi:hypothetical protein